MRRCRATARACRPALALQSLRSSRELGQSNFDNPGLRLIGFGGDFDQRHTLNLFIQQRFSYRMNASAKLRLGSSFPIVGYFTGTPMDLFLGADRNAVRVPSYSRLDLRLSRTFTYDRSRMTLFLEVMNAAGHRNFGQADGSIRSSLQAVNFVERLIPRVPSAGILLEF